MRGTFLLTSGGKERTSQRQGIDISNPVKAGLTVHCAGQSSFALSGGEAGASGKPAFKPPMVRSGTSVHSCSIFKVGAELSASEGRGENGNRPVAEDPINSPGQTSMPKARGSNLFPLRVQKTHFYRVQSSLEVKTSQKQHCVATGIEILQSDSRPALQLFV